jgi:hypothetical protein
MSYDLMVFDPAAGPREPAAFMTWYRQQTEWAESHDYNNPETPTPALRAWFQEMIQSYPPMNGPLASSNPDDPQVTDYSVGCVVIYAAFAWSQAEEAYRQMLELARKHRVGLFDTSSIDGAVWLPKPNGAFEIAFYASRRESIISRIRKWFGRDRK